MGVATIVVIGASVVDLVVEIDGVEVFVVNWVFDKVVEMVAVSGVVSIDCAVKVEDVVVAFV